MNEIESYKEFCNMKMQRIVSNLRQVPHKKVVWDDTIDLYARKVEHLKSILCLPEFNEKASLVGKMNSFLNKCTNQDFQIAFVGTIKTGKSTLINALLGKNYASMGVTPETAALTKFRKSDKDYVKVTFYNKKEWKELWESAKNAENFLNEFEKVDGKNAQKIWVEHEEMTSFIENGKIEDEIKKWTSAKSPEHFFVKEVEVGISTLPPDFPKNVVFVDTPGLSDPVAYRSEVSKKYITNADAAIVCVLAKKIEQTELETLSTVFSVSHGNKEKVHIVATQWDTMNNPIEHWKVQREFNVEQLSSSAFFESRELADKNIMHSAAWIYDICRDFDNSSTDDKKLVRQFYEKVAELTEDEQLDGVKMSVIRENLEYLKKLTNIYFIKEVINTNLVKNYRTYLSSAIDVLYKEIFSETERFTNEKIVDTQKLIDAANSEIDELKKRIQEQKENCDSIGKHKKVLENFMNIVEKSTKKRMKDISSQLSEAEKSFD